MTDYWVSSKKHYCDACKCWISGTTLNIKNHEASARHISSLRKKIIDSHRKQVEKQQQDEFEKAEIARLNNIGADGATNGLAEETADSGLTSSSLFAYSRLLNPPVDKEKEQARVLESITRALSGVPMDDPGATQKTTTWMAFIDQDDGTLTYYNNFTGVKTKVRPRDFDGVLPSASSSLTSNWTLKYDPSKGAKYYRNVQTGEIRWVDRPQATSHHVPSGDSKQVSSTPTMQVEATAATTTSITTTRSSTKGEPLIKIKIETTETAPSPQAPPSVPDIRVKPEPEEECYSADTYAPNNQSASREPVKPKEQYATSIGEWEVVKPEQSVFGHSIVSLEPYINPPKEPPRDPTMFDIIREATFETPLLNVDDLQLQEKRTFDKKHDISDPKEPVQFVKRKLPRKK